MNLSYFTQPLWLICFLVTSTCCLSCKRYVDVGSPKNALTSDKVYTDSATAISAVLALYSQQSSPMQNSFFGMLSSDEGHYVLATTYSDYQNNTLSANNNNLIFVHLYLYRTWYQEIQYANANIEGIRASTTLSDSFKNQAIGECLFWRAFSYFYLVNYWGAVPLITSTDVQTNARLPRAPIADVYKQMEADLLTAKSLVSLDYPSTFKARINRAAVSAFLSRVYLYEQNWAQAEAEASEVINSGGYQLESNLSDVFINTSKEVIWQTVSLNSNSITGVTEMGTFFLPYADNMPQVALYDQLGASFEPGDLRKANWIRSIDYQGITYLYPYKYRLNDLTKTGNEYNVMLRLAELYLIRAEARVRQGDLAGAQADLSVIRQRAGLPQKTLSNQAEALEALEQERRVELFTEWGDRWFNLKRTGRIDAVMAAQKPNWQPHQALYPFYPDELIANPNLEQNPGY